jgi:hypothetical protein
MDRSESLGSGERPVQALPGLPHALQPAGLGFACVSRALAMCGALSVSGVFAVWEGVAPSDLFSPSPYQKTETPPSSIRISEDSRLLHRCEANNARGLPLPPACWAGPEREFSRDATTSPPTCIELFGIRWAGATVLLFVYLLSSVLASSCLLFVTTGSRPRPMQAHAQSSPACQRWAYRWEVGTAISSSAPRRNWRGADCYLSSDLLHGQDEEHTSREL